MARPISVHVIYIKTTPERVWAALTDGALTEQYYFGMRVACAAWKPGARFTYAMADGTVVSDGEVLECDPPRRLVLAQRILQYETPPAPGIVAHDIEQIGPVVKLTITETDPIDAPDDWRESAEWGVNVMLSALKSLLETGEAFSLPMG